jgi:DNA-binding transcriptional regulator YbjK
MAPPSPASAAPAPLPRAEQRRRLILAAVLRVIAEGGVDAVTHRRVAAAAGSSLGSTTYHFDTRDALILEAFRFHIARQNEQMSMLEASTEVRDEAAFLEALVEWTERELADEAPLRAEYELILYAARDEHLAREYWAWQQSLESLVAERLERLGRRHALETARIVTGLIRAYELERLAHRPLDADDLRRRLRHVLQGGPA